MIIVVSFYCPLSGHRLGLGAVLYSLVSLARWPPTPAVEVSVKVKVLWSKKVTSSSVSGSMLIM